jgi:hypothetical protein
MTSNKRKSTDDLALERFEEFGNEMSGPRSFGATMLKYSGVTGEWTTGKNGTSMNGKKLVADIADLMKGWQSFNDRKPIYVLVRVADGKSPPRREDLGDTNEQLWDAKQGDPWKLATALPLFDPETHETFIFATTTDGGKSAVGLLAKAFAAEQRKHSGATLPIVELDTDSYVNNSGKRIFTPIFDIIGWTDRPAAVKHSLPPPMPCPITGKSEVSPSVKAEHAEIWDEPPPYSDDELTQLVRENDGRAEDDTSF